MAAVVIGLSAVVFSVQAEALCVLTVRDGPDGAPGLPSGPFDADQDRTFELALRRFITTQTGFVPGYVEQLYTFGDAGRDAPQADAQPGARVVSVGYLALTSPEEADRARLIVKDAAWAPVTGFFPYEDRRHSGSDPARERLIRALADWAAPRAPRRARVSDLFGDGSLQGWNEERVLERYELLYEAGLVAEAARDRSPGSAIASDVASGRPMRSDHRRILATALGRLRGKLKYRPVVFGLMPETFTLLGLQRTVEAVAGLPVHKQNFRRALERAELLEATGQLHARTGGRPAELYRYRPRAAGLPALGLSIPVARTPAR